MLKTHMLQLRVVVLGCAIGIVMGIAGGVYSTSNADAGEAYNFGYFTSYDDVFRNYDFTSQWESQYNVDWAVTMIFTNNASVSKVENSLVNHGYSANGGWMYGRVTDNSVDWVRYGQEGKKMKTCNDYHLRVYADQYDSMLHNPGLGYFVFGTTHRDYREQSGCGSGRYHGYGETAESHFAQVFRNDCNKPVYVDAVNMYNNENWRYEVRNGIAHYWSNDRYATQVFFPVPYQSCW
jgi:hypothetical protein